MNVVMEHLSIKLPAAQSMLSLSIVHHSLTGVDESKKPDEVDHEENAMNVEFESTVATTD
jgi:hypothetical protein